MIETNSRSVFSLWPRHGFGITPACPNHWNNCSFDKNLKWSTALTATFVGLAIVFYSPNKSSFLGMDGQFLPQHWNCAGAGFQQVMIFLPSIPTETSCWQKGEQVQPRSSDSCSAQGNKPWQPAQKLRPHTHTYTHAHTHTHTHPELASKAWKKKNVWYDQVCKIVALKQHNNIDLCI